MCIYIYVCILLYLRGHVGIMRPLTKDFKCNPYKPLRNPTFHFMCIFFPYGSPLWGVMSFALGNPNIADSSHHPHKPLYNPSVHLIFHVPLDSPLYDVVFFFSSITPLPRSKPDTDNGKRLPADFGRNSSTC